MFDFQKEVIINSKVLDDGVTPRFAALVDGKELGSDGFTYHGKVPVFRVSRCADYRKEGLVEGVIYRTTGKAGVLGKAEFTKPAAAGTYRVVIEVALVGKYLADYAMPWSKFSKPILAEFEIGTADTANAQDIMYKAVKAAIPENYPFVKVTKSSTDKVVVTCTDSHQVIVKAVLQKQEDLDCPESCTEKMYVPASEAVTITKNEMEIGTAAWLQENLRFPSYPNLRYAALNSEEYPVAGGLYTQFSFLYCMPRKGLHGQGTVGQAMKSVTTHTFYVLDSLVSEFETALKDVFGKDSIVVLDPDVNSLIKIEFLNADVLTADDLKSSAGEVLEIDVSGPYINGDVSSSVKFELLSKTDVYEIAEGKKLRAKSGQDEQIKNEDRIEVKATYAGASTTKVFGVQGASEAV